MALKGLSLLRNANRIRPLDQLNNLQATCSIATLGRKDLKEKKKIIEELSKLKIQDRTVFGKDGVTKFYPVIRSPYILPIVFWTKFKIFLTAGTTLTVAADLLLSLNLGPVVYSALGVSCATLLISGEYVRRVIGFLYLSEDESQVRISRVSFLGRRIDFELPLEDIHPLTDTGQDHRSDIYKIHLEPGCPASKSLGPWGFDRCLYVAGGEKSVINPERFNAIFGSVIDIKTTDGSSDALTSPSPPSTKKHEGV